MNCHRLNGDPWHFDLTYRDIGGRAEYSFPEFQEVDEQFAAIFRKLDQLYPCTVYNLNITFQPFKLLVIRTVCCTWKIIKFLEFLSQGCWLDTLKVHSSTFDFWPLINLWVTLKPLISKCSMMPAWHQPVLVYGHVEESVTATKLHLFMIFRCTSVSTWLELKMFFCQKHWKCSIKLKNGLKSR